MAIFMLKCSKIIFEKRNFPLLWYGRTILFLRGDHLIKKSNWTNEEDLKLIKLFKLGYKSKDIANELKRTKEAVQKRIQMFKKKEILYERDRKLGKIENREINKAINRENNKFMSNRALIKSSISAYKNNHKGDLVLDTKKS